MPFGAHVVEHELTPADHQALLEGASGLIPRMCLSTSRSIPQNGVVPRVVHELEAPPRRRVRACRGVARL